MNNGCKLNWVIINIINGKATSNILTAKEQHPWNNYTVSKGIYKKVKFIFTANKHDSDILIINIGIRNIRLSFEGVLNKNIKWRIEFN